jgi:hypothetical protein
MINITHLRIKGLALTSGHGRYITAATPERTIVPVEEWPFPLKRLRNGRFKSETATWIQKWFKKSVGTSGKL